MTNASAHMKEIKKLKGSEEMLIRYKDFTNVQ